MVGLFFFRGVFRKNVAVQRKSDYCDDLNYQPIKSELFWKSRNILIPAMQLIVEGNENSWKRTWRYSGDTGNTPASISTCFCGRCFFAPFFQNDLLSASLCKSIYSESRACLSRFSMLSASLISCYLKTPVFEIFMYRYNREVEVSRGSGANRRKTDAAIRPISHWNLNYLAIW